MRIKRVWAGVAAWSLLLILMLPQLALANPAASITLSQTLGHCGDQIEARATVDSPGTYRICWNSRTPDSVKETFTTTGAANYSAKFLIPETVKGTYAVYLTTEAYSLLATSNLTVVPSVKISPEQGPVGTVATFTGNGFAASQDIQVSFLGTASTRQANTVGSWTLNYTIPATPASAYTFKVEFKEGTIWYDLVGKDFEVTPRITAPSEGTVGRTIEVIGTGFQSKEKGIEVTFDGTVGNANTPIVADDRGSWTAAVVVPALQRGTYTIGASGPLTRARDVAGVKDFNLGAGILVEPISAYVGDTVSVSGGGFAAKETGIKVTFAGTTVASGTAKMDGTWEFTFVLPSSTYGSNTVSASGDITTAVTSSLSTKASMEQPSPVQGAPGDSVTLTGKGFSGSKKLTVTIGGLAASEDVSTQPNGNFVVTVRVPKGSPEGKQPLVVKDAGEATASTQFTVIKKDLATPQPISPQKGNRLWSGQATFEWGAVTGGSNITYILQISDKPDLATYVWSKSDVGASSYTLSEEEALTKGTYYWWVKAVDDYGNQSPWSDSSSFNVFLIPTWLWVVIGLVILIVLMVVAYRETKFRIAE